MLRKFGCGRTKPQKSMWHYWKVRIFFFCVFSTVWTFFHRRIKPCFLPLAHNLSSKTGIFFRPWNGKNWNFNNHKQLIIQMIIMASCIKEIYLKVLGKQASWTYVRLIFEPFLVISWLWFALDHLRCWEDRC